MAIINDAFSDLNLFDELIQNYYTIEKFIAVWRYGVIKLASSKINSNLKFAVKVINLEKVKSQSHSIIQEILALKKIDHSNVVKIFEIFKDSTKLYILLEHVEGKELFDFIIENQKISEHQASKIAAQLIKTVKYLNKYNIWHRDLKPENIMVNPDTLNIKIVDFGHAHFSLILYQWLLLLELHIIWHQKYWTKSMEKNEICEALESLFMLYLLGVHHSKERLMLNYLNS